MNSLEICIMEYPDREDFDISKGENPALLQISLEFDSALDLIVNGQHVLSSKKEDHYKYPLFEFLSSFANGIRELLESGQAIIRIYLQQYSFSATSPCHTLLPRRENHNLWQCRVDFHWYSELAKPADLPSVHNELIEIEDLITAYNLSAIQFEQTTKAAILPLFPNVAAKLNEIFTRLPNVIRAWDDYQSRFRSQERD